MPKVVVGSMKHRTLIEGDENLLESHEILLKEDDKFDFVLKERDANGKLKTYIVTALDKYIQDLKDAYDEGVAAKLN